MYNILIEGNVLEHNKDYGIFFSRNVHDSIARNNHVYNSSIGLMVSESPNNEIYNNTIEGGTSQGIHLFNPVLPDDGMTEGNLINNTTFYDIEESEYRLFGDSSIRIKGQHFDNALISQDGSVTTIRH